MRAILIALCLCLLAAPAAWAETPGAHVRVVDVDESLCVIVRTPEGRTMLFDAGDQGRYCARAVAELAPERRIDLLVISRLDRANVGELEAIIASNAIAEVLHPGLEGDRRGFVRNIKRGLDAQGARQWAVADIAPGHVFELGEARVTFIGGWRDGRETRAEGEPPVQPPALQRQAASIAVRVEYGGHSVLLAGSSIGRAPQHSASACAYGERIMAAGSTPLQSDVIILQPHDLSLSQCFVEAVRPSAAVFSSTLLGGHRRVAGASPMSRLEAFGLTRAQIFETGRSPCRAFDAPIASRESESACREGPGDDDVDIWLPRDGALRIAYARP